MYPFSPAMASGSNRRQRRQFSSSLPISGMDPSRTAFDSPSTAGFTKHRRLHPAPPASPSTAGFTKHCRLHPAPPAEPKLDPHHTHLPTSIQARQHDFSPLSEIRKQIQIHSPFLARLVNYEIILNSLYCISFIINPKSSVVLHRI